MNFFIKAQPDYKLETFHIVAERYKVNTSNCDTHMHRLFKMHRHESNYSPPISTIEMQIWYSTGTVLTLNRINLYQSVRLNARPIRYYHLQWSHLTREISILKPYTNTTLHFGSLQCFAILEPFKATFAIMCLPRKSLAGVYACAHFIL